MAEKAKVYGAGCGKLLHLSGIISLSRGLPTIRIVNVAKGGILMLRRRVIWGMSAQRVFRVSGIWLGLPYCMPCPTLPPVYWPGAACPLCWA